MSSPILFFIFIDKRAVTAIRNWKHGVTLLLEWVEWLIIRIKLFSLGFGFVWINQGVENINIFIQELKERLIVCLWQDWNSHINSSVYWTYGMLNSVKSYLSMNLDHLQSIMATFRMGKSIVVQYFRHKHDVQDLISIVCKLTEEDEVHFVFHCDPRVRYSHRRSYTLQNL